MKVAVPVGYILVTYSLHTYRKKDAQGPQIVDCLYCKDNLQAKRIFGQDVFQQMKVKSSHVLPTSPFINLSSLEHVECCAKICLWDMNSQQFSFSQYFLHIM